MSELIVAPSQARLTIAATRAPAPARVAPEAVLFEAFPAGFPMERPHGSTWYRPDMHEIFYEWDFGDPGARWTAPQNTLETWRDANRAFTQVAAHVYRRPGRYRITCTARRIVEVEPFTVIEARDSVEIEIGDIEDLFEGDVGTTIVALDGDFTGRPARGVERRIETNPSTILDWRYSVENFGANGARVQRVLFKRGETYANPCWPHGAFEKGLVDFVYFGSWGDPDLPPPTFRNLGQGGSNGKGAVPVVFDGLAALGQYDPMTETPGPTRNTGMVMTDGGYCLLNDLSFSSLMTGIIIDHYRTGQREFGPATIVLNNCSMERLAHYGVFSAEREDSVVAMLGCRDTDPGDAPMGGDNDRDALGNEQGPVRIHARGDVIVDGGDYFARYGWTLGAEWPDGVRATAQQACLRCFSSETNDTEGRLFVTRTSGEAGPLLSLGSTPGRAAPRGNVLVDMVIHVGSPATRQVIQCQMGALTVRNGLFIKPAVEGDLSLLSIVHQPRIRKDDRISIPLEVYFEPIAVYSNTIAVLNRGAPVEPLAIDDNWVNFTESNNLVYAPATPGQPDHRDFAPFDATPLWEPRWLGRLEYPDEGVLQVQYRPPPDTVSLFRPLPGSPVIGAATAGYVPLWDLLGNPRWPTLTLGAVEPPAA